MADDVKDTAPENKPEETIEEQVEALKEEVAEVVQTTANAIERLFDVTLGVGVLAFEKVDGNLRRLWEDAPGVCSDLEAKGRPVRTKITDSLKLKTPTVGDAFKAGGQAAEDDIEMLENRVKELEQQVSAPAETREPSRGDMLELDEGKPRRRPKKADPEKPAE